VTPRESRPGWSGFSLYTRQPIIVDDYIIPKLLYEHRKALDNLLFADFLRIEMWTNGVNRAGELPERKNGRVI
jgi:hypothetical protein